MFKHDFTKLEPSTTYSISLKSYSPLGESQHSGAVVATTLGGGKEPKLVLSSLQIDNPEYITNFNFKLNIYSEHYVGVSSQSVIVSTVIW